MKIVDPGTHTLIQDYPGRQGFNRWRVGIPLSGPMDDYSFRVANRLVGNEETAAALEITIGGPTVVFNEDTLVAITGAPIQAFVDGQPVDCWKSFVVKKGQTLKMAHLQAEGVRSYLAVAGLFRVWKLTDSQQAVSTYLTTWAANQLSLLASWEVSKRYNFLTSS
jgi:urea carboxylase